jgi:hypothetical protein
VGALKRLGTGGAFSLVAAILLFVLLFLRWYGPRETAEESLLMLIREFSLGETAWQAVASLSVFLAGVVAVVAVVASLRLGGAGRRPAAALGAMIGVLGLVAAGLILYRIGSPPGTASRPGVTTDRAVLTPAYLAFAAALAIAAGGLWTVWEEAGVGARGLDLESSA